MGKVRALSFQEGSSPLNLTHSLRPDLCKLARRELKMLMKIKENWIKTINM